MDTLTRNSPPRTPTRVVITKPGLDGHDPGAKVVPRALKSIIELVGRSETERP